MIEQHVTIKSVKKHYTNFNEYVMLVFLKKTITQINVETRQGKVAVTRAQQTPCPAATEPGSKRSPKNVDAVTGGTQGISRYFAAQVQVQPLKPEADET